MSHDARWLLGAALLVAWACGDGGIAPPGEDEGRRLGAQFEHLADSVDGAGWSPTADALRHAAEIVRLTGHATPVSLTIDGEGRSFLAVAEQLDFPNLVCTWPGDSGVAPPPGDGGDGEPPPPPPPPPSDTLFATPEGSRGDPSTDPGEPPMPPSPPDSVIPPSTGGTPGECREVGVFSMRTLIAWEPERMAEVVRIVADAGSNQVEPRVPDVMTGLPTNAAGDPPAEPDSASVPGDTVGGSGGGGGSPGYPGFMGEYLVREVGAWFAVEGRQANSLEGDGGACTSDRAAFDWAEFACSAARFGFEFAMRVEPIGVLRPPVPVPEPGPEPRPASGQFEGEHSIAMERTDVDGVRLTVVAWSPPPVPEPGPVPPDSTVTTRAR